MFAYKTEGVCAKEIRFEVQDQKIVGVYFLGGCPGNLAGIASLVKGMDIYEVIEKLEGITCGNKITSCPDQFAKALKIYIQTNQKSA